MTTEVIQNETSAKIAVLNDEHRRNMQGCTVTKGIVAMGSAANEVFVGVRDYVAFTEDNDPYGEHDFGSLVVAGEKVFWKIDYYDENLKNWCDPLDSDCQRVLTIMLAEEY